jgi:hypothetical protein
VTSEQNRTVFCLSAAHTFAAQHEQGTGSNWRLEIEVAFWSRRKRANTIDESTREQDKLDQSIAQLNRLERLGTNREYQSPSSGNDRRQANRTPRVFWRISTVK